VSNVLNEEQKQQVIALGRLGWSLRRIERETSVRRETVSAYLKEAGIALRLPRGRRIRAKPASRAGEVTPDSALAKPASEAVEVPPEPGGSSDLPGPAGPTRVSTAPPRRQVAAMFAEEKPSLQPLPVEPFRYYQFGKRTVNLDGCVESMQPTMAHRRAGSAGMSRCNGILTRSACWTR